MGSGESLSLSVPVCHAATAVQLTCPPSHWAISTRVSSPTAQVAHGNGGCSLAHLFRQVGKQSAWARTARPRCSRSCYDPAKAAFVFQEVSSSAGLCSDSPEWLHLQAWCPLEDEVSRDWSPLTLMFRAEPGEQEAVIVATSRPRSPSRRLYFSHIHWMLLFSPQGLHLTCGGAESM